jgi:hypothetical protein
MTIIKLGIFGDQCQWNPMAIQFDWKVGTGLLMVADGTDGSQGIGRVIYRLFKSKAVLLTNFCKILLLFSKNFETFWGLATLDSLANITNGE